MEYLAIPPALEVYFYALLFIFALVFFIGLAGKLSILARAGGEGPGVSGVLILSVASFFSADCLVARRVFPRSRVRGLMLVAIMWGFVVSLATLVVSWVANLLGLGPPYPLVSIAGELAGAVLLLALLYGLIRKLYVDRKGEVWTVPEDYTFLVLFFILVLSGFLVEGARISLGGGDSYSPVGGALALPPESFQYLLLLHSLLFFLILAYLPFSKSMHMVVAQITTRLAREKEERYY